MFTGIIEELGIIVDQSITGTSLCLKIEAGGIFSVSAPGREISQNGLKIGDSIAVNGVCLTATNVKPPYFEVTAVRETLEKTTLGSLTIGTRINLERAATLETRLGGHLVQGHVDTTATLRNIRDEDGSWQFTFELPRLSDHAGFESYVVSKGSITVDGISLTVAAFLPTPKEGGGQVVTIAIIPHTYQHTNVRFLTVGDRVNVEFDIIAKMVERLVKPYRV